MANRKDGFEVIKGAAKAFVEIGAPAVEPLFAAPEHGYEGLRQVPALRAALPVRRCLARVEQQWRP